MRLKWAVVYGFCTLAGAQSLELSLKRAVEIATSPQGAAQVLAAGEAVRQAEARAVQSRAALLPNVDGSISEIRQTRNLQAFGLNFALPIPGFAFPSVVGPYNVFDLRATATQSVFDLAAIRRYQAAKVQSGAARAEESAAKEGVAAQVARAYVAALRAVADVEAAEANVTLAEAVLKQAEHLKTAGTGTGIEVTRANVQLSSEKQRLLVASNERRRARLQLIRAMNLPIDTDVRFTDSLTFRPPAGATIAEATAKALGARPDLAAQRERELSTKLSASAVKFERLPSLAALGDFGTIGASPASNHATRSYGVSMRMPLFDGGRRDARRAEAASQVRVETIRTKDLRETIALDVRLALDALKSAEEEVAVSKEGLALSESELAQARRRYEAGVTPGLEVTDAQTRLARARDNHITALFHHAAARIDLAQATGTVRQEID